MAFDYLVEHVAQAGGAVPDQLWQVSLAEARPSEWMDLGYAAYRSADLPRAEHAFGKAAEAGDGQAMTHLGVLLQRRGRLAEAETWFRRAVNAGHAAVDREVMTRLGVLLQRRGSRRRPRRGTAERPRPVTGRR